MSKRLEPAGWKELLRRTEELLAGQLHQPAIAFLASGNLDVGVIGRVVRDALIDVDAAGGRERVRFAQPTRSALATAFGACKLELAVLMAELTLELATSVRANLTGVPNACTYEKIRGGHEAIERRINELGSQLSWLTYAMATLYKMGYGEWELL